MKRSVALVARRVAIAYIAFGALALMSQTELGQLLFDRINAILEAPQPSAWAFCRVEEGKKVCSV